MKEESASITTNVPIEIVAGLLKEAVGPTKMDEVLRKTGRPIPKPPKVVESEWPSRIVYEYPDARIEVNLLRLGETSTSAAFRITWRGWKNRDMAIDALTGFAGILEWFERGYLADKSQTLQTSENATKEES